MHERNRNGNGFAPPTSAQLQAFWRSPVKMPCSWRLLTRLWTPAGRCCTAPRARPAVELRDVTVVYPGGNVGLDGASATIGRGEFAFLVGQTGCGKSTFIKLLLREMDPSRGKVLIAGPRHRRAAAQEDPQAAPQHRRRVPGLQAAAEPHHLRQRRVHA